MLKHSDYLTIYALIVFPVINAASFFLEDSKANTLRQTNILYAVLVLVGSLIRLYFLSQQETNKTISYSEDYINRIVNQTIYGRNKKDN